MLKTSNFVSPFPDANAVGAIPSPLGKTTGTGNAVFWFQPIGGTTLGPNLGGSSSGTGTISTAVTPGSASNVARWRRALATGAAAINTSAGIGTGYTRWSRSSTGGFDAWFHFAIEANTTGHGAFVGMSPTLSGNLSGTTITSVLNSVGIGFEAADSSAGTWFLIYNDGSGSATKTAIAGMTRTTTESYIMRITCPQGAAANITVSIFNATTGAVILAPTVLTTKLPAANTSLAPAVAMRTDGVITTAPVVSCMGIYITAQD